MTRYCVKCEEEVDNDYFNDETNRCYNCDTKAQALEAIKKIYKRNDSAMIVLLSDLKISHLLSKIDYDLTIEEIAEIYEDAMHWEGTEGYEIK
ncbi:MAG: hypothetical protein ACOCRO_04020 [Halanaerobiales bacterium]